MSTNEIQLPKNVRKLKKMPMGMEIWLVTRVTVSTCTILALLLSKKKNFPKYIYNIGK